jgi:hypothetical protein
MITTIKQASPRSTSKPSKRLDKVWADAVMGKSLETGLGSVIETGEQQDNCSSILP